MLKAKGFAGGDSSSNNFNCKVGTVEVEKAQILQ